MVAKTFFKFLKPKILSTIEVARRQKAKQISQAMEENRRAIERRVVKNPVNQKRNIVVAVLLKRQKKLMESLEQKAIDLVIGKHLRKMPSELPNADAWARKVNNLIMGLDREYREERRIMSIDSLKGLSQERADKIYSAGIHFISLIREMEKQKIVNKDFVKKCFEINS